MKREGISFLGITLAGVAVCCLLNVGYIAYSNMLTENSARETRERILLTRLDAMDSLLVKEYADTRRLPEILNENNARFIGGKGIGIEGLKYEKLGENTFLLTAAKEDGTTVASRHSGAKL